MPSTPGRKPPILLPLRTVLEVCSSKVDAGEESEVRYAQTASAIMREFAGYQLGSIPKSDTALGADTLQMPHMKVCEADASLALVQLLA